MAIHHYKTSFYCSLLPIVKYFRTIKKCEVFPIFYKSKIPGKIFYEKQISRFIAFMCVANLSFAQTPRKNWPDIPLLQITTNDGTEPTATIVNPPEGCLGNSILSEYVPGHLVMTLKGDTLYDSGSYENDKSGIRIKIRGNSTGAFLQQKPYKLKLSKKADLIASQKDKKSKDWALLSIMVWNPALKNKECNIQHAVGLAICKALDFPWEPRIKFVNVLLNGKYRGLHYLSETVERADCRVKTDDSGFLIENDAYWWKDGEIWFKTNRQYPAMGYTFKYPKPDNNTGNKRDCIAAYMNAAEEALFFHRQTEDYFDYESFARWVLAHDILGSLDVAGSNMYLYKESLGSEEPSESKLKMATLWDFDTCFRVDNTEWSKEHTHEVFYYPQLFKDSAFVAKYKEIYFKYKDALYTYIENYLNELLSVDGYALEQSRLLHRQIYSGEIKNTFDEQIKDILAHLKTRLAMLENMVKTLQGIETGITYNDADETRIVKRTDLYGRDFTGMPLSELPPNIYLEKYSDGNVKKIVR